jgi:hypothetical protein
VVAASAVTAASRASLLTALSAAVVALSGAVMVSVLKG